MYIRSPEVASADVHTATEVFINSLLHIIHVFNGFGGVDDSKEMKVSYNG